MRESRGGRPWFPVPNSPTVSADVKQHWTEHLTELKSCVKVEVAVLGFQSLIVLVSVDVKQHLRKNWEVTLGGSLDSFVLNHVTSYGFSSESSLHYQHQPAAKRRNNIRVNRAPKLHRHLMGMGGVVGGDDQQWILIMADSVLEYLYFQAAQNVSHYYNEQCNTTGRIDNKCYDLSPQPSLTPPPPHTHTHTPALSPSQSLVRARAHIHTHTDKAPW